MIKGVFIFFVRFLAGASARWRGCDPALNQRIYFANHTSNLDGPVLWSALPPAMRDVTRPVAAHDYWTATAVRNFIATRIFNAVLIERKKVTVSNNPLEHMLAAMGKNYSLIIFPEGGRSHNPEPGQFKSGLYHLAKARPDIELIPVYIDNMNRILPKGEFLPVPLLSCITFGAPVKVGEGEDKASFLARARAAVIDLRKE